MLYLALKNRKNKDERPVIAATRNAHKAFIYACALLDIDIFWLYSSAKEFSLCECKVSTEDIEKGIKDSGAFAVYITSPDYLGNVLDIKSIAESVDLLLVSPRKPVRRLVVVRAHDDTPIGILTHDPAWQ